MRWQSNSSNPTSIYQAANLSNLAFPGPAAYPFYSASQSNTCNVYIPNDSTLSRCPFKNTFCQDDSCLS